MGHDSVVRCHHENRDVGDLSTTSTHSGERLVAGGVNERDRTFDALVLRPHLVGTDCLGDATGFARGNIGATDRVEETGLSVVNVSHDSNNGRSDDHVLVVVFGLEVNVERVEDFLVLVFGAHNFDSVAEFSTENLEGCSVE